ncbi:MAG: cobalamin biosynthesis protein CobD [Acidimicrobiaceae bacterium]|nr:adenosylcobinamide-phosphate synthase CbiB [Acidimicrobiaceae bacterium]MCY3643008.1 adenosylcobinamide-phosphate synthase CbiB [Acidimicrobiaceae bacterium]MDE0665465.1 adenosylcobinamide-phosphate synthase CbiB [Acidimicrobiaceae bacterium]MXW89305.1 cobalamin biosynthesis protein CobD [Acidimicrobiaceae bacterium]MYI14199.1 cobalamin biosynthesis protein CobD [Acidimicrobiaceae bacterium]
MNRLGRRCLAAAAGLVLDRLVGEPPADVHPVAGFGRTMERIEEALWADRRLNGAVYALSGAVMGAAAGSAAGSTAVATWAVAAGRELRRVASRVGELTAAGDLAAARAELPSLVGRDPSELDASEIAAAVIESVAENSVDAVIAPAFWAAIAGAPGAVAYRAINTMDAMVGRRDERYGNFGWAAARLDDMANYVPARIFAGLVAVLRPDRAREILSAVRRDAKAHPSPNAGVAEAAMAAALGRELGGPLRYGTVTENRPLLGNGPRPDPDDVPEAVRIAGRAEWAVVGTLCLICLAAWLKGRARRLP